MADILIKGMEMPKCCSECQMFDWYVYGCKLCSFGIPSRYGYDAETKPGWCPLIEVLEDVQPVAHGKNLNEEWPSLFECSICHWSCWDTYCGDTDTYNYCPNCGAKMENNVSIP